MANYFTMQSMQHQHRRLVTRPSAFVPVFLGLGALALVLGYAAAFGTAPQPDEGTAAHVWQLVMAADVLLIALFALRWLPASPREALAVLALQIGCALAAAFPVWWFGW